MIPGPGDHRATRRDRLRASHAERDQVIGTLKDAFVQGRLTRDEFDSRVGHALVSRTRADLTALTADLPAPPPATGKNAAKAPSRGSAPARPAHATIRNGARVIAASTVLTGSLWAGALLRPADSQALGGLVFAVTFVWLGIVLLAGSVMLEARSRHRHRPGCAAGRTTGG